MLPLLLGVFLVLAPADTTDQQRRCDRLFQNAHSIDPYKETMTLEEWRWFLDKVRETKTCYVNAGTDPDYRYYRGIYTNEVWALNSLRRNEEAMEVVESFFERFDPSSNTYGFGRMYWWRGQLHFLRGDLAEAVPDYVRTLDHHTDWKPEVLPGLYLDIGMALERIRDFDKAQRFFQVVDSMIQTAEVSSPLLRLSRAKSLYLRANSIIEKTDFIGLPDSAAYEQAGRLAEASVNLLKDDLLRHPTVDENMAHALILLSESRAFLGDIESARRHLDEAERIIRRDNDDYLSYHLLRKRGRLFMQVGDFEAAQRAFDESLRLARTTPSILPDAKRRILRDLGHLAEVRGDYVRAVEYYIEAIQVTEAFRESLRSTDWAAQAFADWQESHRSLVRVLLAQKKYEAAFAALEQTRARHLLDLRTQSMLRSVRSPEDRAHLDSLTATLIHIRNQLATDTLTSAERTALITREQQIIPEQKSLLALDDSLTLPSIDAVQRVLAAQNQVVLSYFLDETSISDRLFGRTPLPHVFILTPDTLTVVPLPISSDSLRSLLAQVSPLFEKPEALPTFDDRMFSLAALHQLYNRLYAPAAPFIPNEARLIVIPDGLLFMLPFSMLVEEETPGYQYREAPYLMRKHPISIELATALLLNKPAVEAQPTYDVVAFGKSQFSDTKLPSRLRATRDASETLINLPAVVEEIEAIDARFGSVSLRLDEEATEAAFFETAASAKILHLASHTLMRPSMPLQNAIILSKDPMYEQYDGILYLHEIQQRSNMPTDLVVLSGCGTARGVFHRGEGMAGLQYAFRALGVKSSLATSWFVDDKTAVLIMEAFYRNLKKGLPKDIALQQAQLHYLDKAKDENASPFLWAAPMIYGDTASMTLKGPRSWWLPGLGLLLLGLLYFGYRIRKRPR